MSILEERALDLFDKLDQLTTQYTPKVVDSAIGAVQVTGISQIVYGVVGAVSFFITWYLAKKIIDYCAERKDNRPRSDWGAGIFFGYLVGVIICISLFFGLIWNLFDAWAWVAIFNPELALAHKILGL